MEFDFEFWVELAKIAVMLLSGGIVVPAVNKLKELLNLEKYAAFALTAVVSALFGIAVVFAEGQLVEVDLRPDNLSVVFGVIFASSKIVYDMLEKRKE
ncbi:MAG: hypothetical protein GY938_27165 [Ketobacter sp.]|nr:hypothetical protein [Ketobacter sp.]